MSKLSYRTIIEATVAAWNSHDLEGLGDHLSDDITLHHPSLDTPLVGKDTYLAYDRRFLEAFPDARIQVKNIATADDVAAMEFIMHGTNHGHFRGKEPTGRSIKIPIVEIFAFKGNKICEVRRYLDPSLYGRQLDP